MSSFIRTTSDIVGFGHKFRCKNCVSPDFGRKAGIFRISQRISWPVFVCGFDGDSVAASRGGCVAVCSDAADPKTSSSLYRS